MKVAAINIQRGFLTKVDVIEQFLLEENIDVLALSEIDTMEEDILPSIQGYSITRQLGKKTRVIMVVKESLRYEVTQYHGSLPCVVINTEQSTFATVYNDFTGGEVNPHLQLCTMTSLEVKEDLKRMKGQKG